MEALTARKQLDPGNAEIYALITRAWDALEERAT